MWFKKNSKTTISTKKRLTHPITLVGYALAGAALAVILLTFTTRMGYTTGTVSLSVIIFLKIGFNIWRNTELMPKQNDGKS